MSAKLEPVVYNEGLLLKRQRGLRQGNAKKLRFQERFCRLTSTSLDYYDPQLKKRIEGPKGQFAVEQIKIAEVMAKDIFGKEYPYAFQIGDNTEIMYFVARNEEEMAQWIAACRHVAKDAGNAMLSHHHHGVFGLINKGRWSCCANPRRGCPGCSPSTGLDSSKTAAAVTVSLRTTPPSSKKSPRNDKKFTKSVDMCQNSMDDSEDEILVTEVPKIRRFTLADPLLMPLTPKKVKSLRNPINEKESSMEEECTDEELELKGEENLLEKNKRTNNPSSSSSKPGSSGGGGGVKNKPLGKVGSMELISTVAEGEEERSETSEELDNCSSEGRTGEGKKADLVEEEELKGLAEDKIRDSPSPSIDSGCGISRPSSQTDTVDMRVHRAESIGKKSVQSVVSDLGVVSDDNNKQSFCKEVIMEETDGPGRPSGNRKMSERSFDSETSESKETNLLTSKSRSSTADNDKKVSVSPSVSMSLPGNAVHIRQRPSSSVNNRPRSSMYDSSGSEMSRSITPQHKKLLTQLSSPSGQERPRSIIMKGGIVALDIHYLPVFSPLHQASQDGNLGILMEELNSGQLLDLDEPSNGSIPYTPLFLAYINDHFQTMVTLLEHGANPDTVDPVEKAGLLQWACEKGVLDMADLLIKYKADVNKKDVSGNTPLMVACRNGHFDIVQLLLESGAHVDEDNSSQRTALHEAAEAERADITELLLRQSEVDPASRDDKDRTPYDIAYSKKNDELIRMLQVALPTEVRPYLLSSSSAAVSSQMITTIVFNGKDSIITGSRDCKVKFLRSSNLSEASSITLGNTVLDVSASADRYVLMGSTSIQLVDLESPDRRRTIADDVEEDENLLDPPLHLAKFGPTGRVVTASVESNVLKFWPAVANVSSPDVQPEVRVQVKEDRDSVGSIYSLDVSSNPEAPWVAVGLQPGDMLKPKGFKLVYCYSWNSRKLEQIFDSGAGGLGTGVSTMFSPNGKHLAIGCGEHLCVWEVKSGDLLQKFTVNRQAAVTCLTYSPDGTHLAAGLDSGEVQIFHTTCGFSMFSLPGNSCHSPVTAVSYSKCGKKFASGYRNGVLRIWEAYVGQTEALAS